MKRDRLIFAAWLLGGAAVIAVVGGFLFAWSGLYSVSAAKGHWAATRWFLEFGMRNSVETHAFGLEPPPALDDIALIARGAGHFHTGCAPCHGVPEQSRSPIAQQMLPAPPELSEHVTKWGPEELFWIVKHGLKYTGMPAWPTQERNDEVWAMVAFLLRLPALDGAEYGQLALGDMAGQGLPAGDAARLLELGEPVTASPAACARCHGTDGAGRGNSAFPRLAGQSEQYLYETLKSFASGARPSGIMGPVAAALTDNEMAELARYYAALNDVPAATPAQVEDRAASDFGEKLVADGAPDDGVPACGICHGPSPQARNPMFPTLAGQYAEYISGQLRLWQQGVRGGTAYAPIMQTIAERMTEAQIDAAASYYAARPPSGERASAISDN